MAAVAAVAWLIVMREHDVAPGLDDLSVDAIASAPEFVPLFWLTLFSAAEVVDEGATPDARGRTIAICDRMDALARSRRRIERLQALLPDELTTLGSAWLAHLDAIDEPRLALVIETTGAPRRRRGLRGADLRDRIDRLDRLERADVLRLIREDGAARAAGRHRAADLPPDVALATCGHPGFRPVPWTTRPPREPAPSLARQPRPGDAVDPAPGLVHELRAPRSDRDLRADPRPRPVVWLFSSLVIALLCWASLAVPGGGVTYRGQPPVEPTDLWSIAISIAATAALCARQWRPLLAASLAGALVAGLAGAGYGISGLLLAIPLTVATLAYRRPRWQVLVGVGVVLAGGFATFRLAGDETSDPLVTVFLVAVNLLVGGIARWVARAWRNQAFEAELSTSTPTASP